MRIKEFVNRCIDAGCVWQKEANEPGTRGFYIKCDRFKTTTHFTYRAIHKNDWSTLWNCVVQGRDVLHMSRVCGYFSRIDNWNKSKKGELRDRQHGVYTVK